jgi:hypothetical protein
MNLKEFRKTFRDLSGLYNLVNDDYSNNGVDFFINAGSKFLDRLDETQKSWATHFATLAIGGFTASFPQCRAIKEVWAASPTEGRWQLEKKILQDLVSEYLAVLPATMEQGAPLYYSPCITRSVPKNVVLSDYQKYLGYLQVASTNYNAILLNVPTDEAISVIIHGLFYSDTLSADTDENYWSVNHPMLLYMSTMRQIEIANRSTQGVNDWSNSISIEMKQLGMDLVEEIVAEADEMGDNPFNFYTNYGG